MPYLQWCVPYSIDTRNIFGTNKGEALRSRGVGFAFPRNLGLRSRRTWVCVPAELWICVPAEFGLCSRGIGFVFPRNLAPDRALEADFTVKVTVYRSGFNSTHTGTDAEALIPGPLPATAGTRLNISRRDTYIVSYRDT